MAHNHMSHQTPAQTGISRTKMDSTMLACIENCQDCHAICLQTMTYCQSMGGKYAEAAHIGLLQDCADICRTSADFMLRNSSFHTRTCGVCAEVCEQCARDCDNFGNDAQMKACADMCRQCAASCRQMAGMA